jgi:hypothetical protein
MRQDQYEKLQLLSEKLMDVFLAEANPDDWPGAGVPVGQLDQQSRGDRYWVKKNAVATASLLQRSAVLTGRIQAASAADAGNPEAVAEPESSLDKEIAQAEREAAKLLDQVQKKARKGEFDKRTHGKA